MSASVNHLLNDASHVVPAALGELVIVDLVPTGGTGEHDVVAITGITLTGAKGSALFRAHVMLKAKKGPVVLIILPPYFMLTQQYQCCSGYIDR